MTKTFTENEMILALYGESSPQQQSEWQLTLLNDQEVQELFLDLQAVKTALDQFELQVPERVTDRILSRVSDQKEISL